MDLVVNAYLIPIIVVHEIIHFIIVLIFIKGLHKSFIISLIFKLIATVNEVLLPPNHLPLANCYSIFFWQNKIMIKMINSLVDG